MMEEVQVCQGLSQIFNEISRPLGSRVITLAREKKLDELLQSQATSAQEQTDRMTTKLKPLMNRGRGSPSRFEELWAKVWWHYTKHEGQALLVTLGTVKHSHPPVFSFATRQLSHDDFPTFDGESGICFTLESNVRVPS